MDIKDKIIFKELPADQYYAQEFPKKQIYIHHTVSSGDASNVIHGWQFSPEKVATAFIIDGTGKIYQTFSSKYWAYHLGLHTANNLKLNQESIGIEICNWGQLVLNADGFYRNYYNGVVKKEEVVELQYKNFKYWHKYNDQQLLSLKELLVYLCDKYNIPKTHYDAMFEVNQGALNGIPGIWTHTSVRSDKYDCSNQPNLIATLKSL